MRIVLHTLMNPLTAVILLYPELNDQMKIVFFVVRGFIVPLRDIAEVSLICLLIRVQAKKEEENVQDIFQDK